MTRRHTGRTDVALTPRGEQQAQALGALLAGVEVDRVLSSPMTRALATARLAGFGDRVEQVDALRELDYGEYEGLTTRQIRESRPDWDLFRDGCPGGETVADVARRVRPLLSEINGAGQTVVLFGHGHGLRILATTYLGLEPECARHLVLDTASLSLLGSEHHWPAVLHWNKVSR